MLVHTGVAGFEGVYRQYLRVIQVRFVTAQHGVVGVTVALQTADVTRVGSAALTATLTVGDKPRRKVFHLFFVPETTSQTYSIWPQ